MHSTRRGSAMDGTDQCHPVNQVRIENMRIPSSLAINAAARQLLLRCSTYGRPALMRNSRKKTATQTSTQKPPH